MPMKIVIEKFASLPIFAFCQSPKSSCCHQPICIVLSNDLFIWKILHHKKPLTIIFDAQIEMGAKPFSTSTHST